MNTAIKKYVAKYTKTCSDRSGVLKMFSNFSFIDTDCLISWTRVKMRDTIELFIQFITLTEPTPEGLNSSFKTYQTQL